MAKSPNPDGAWHLYLIECDDGRLYTGITNDLVARFDKHANGKGAAFTRMNKPMRYVACRKYQSLSLAAKAEALLKKQTRAFKVAWAAANPPPKFATLGAPSRAVAAKRGRAAERPPPQR